MLWFNHATIRHWWSLGGPFSIAIGWQQHSIYNQQTLVCRPDDSVPDDSSSAVIIPQFKSSRMAYTHWQSPILVAPKKSIGCENFAVWFVVQTEPSEKNNLAMNFKWPTDGEKIVLTCEHCHEITTIPVYVACSDLQFLSVHDPDVISLQNYLVYVNPLSVKHHSSN